MFCFQFKTTYVMFDSDLKISFEENPKEMQYCNDKLNALSDMFDDRQVAVKQV